MKAGVWRIAVVGAGPAAMYLVEQLLEQDAVAVEIDVYERLPTPWGLVRNGVAPDHPEKKLVIDRLFSYLLADERVRFIGAIEIGRHIDHTELGSWYGAVVYATGADGEMRLQIPGEDLPGAMAARDFVGWCAGHPDYDGRPVDLSCDRAVIVGNGNVALDVARMLALPISALERTEIADQALAALRGSRIREIVILGRRDRASSAFHNPELDELEHLPNVNVTVSDDPDQSACEGTTSDSRRKMATFDRFARRPVVVGDKTIALHFLSSPVALRGAGRVEEMLVMRNRLESDSTGGVVAVPTGEVSILKCGLVVRAVGYRGIAQPGLPFDERTGVIANSSGRIAIDGELWVGRYVAGWAKRGCRGVIGSNKKCARETVRALLSDIADGRLLNPATGSLETMRRVRERHPHIVSYDGWSAINRSELIAGRSQSRPRVKITKTSRLLEVAAAGSLPGSG